MTIKLSVNTWFLLGCIGIVAGFVLLPVLFGSKEDYEVKNTLPILPIQNESLMKGNEITRSDVEKIIGQSNKKMSHQTNTQSITSTVGLTQSDSVSNPRINHTKSTHPILGYTSAGGPIVGYNSSGEPITLSDETPIASDHWSEMKRNGDTISQQMKQTNRVLVPIKSTARVRLDHAISILDGSSTVLATISDNHIGKLTDTAGITIMGVFYSIKDSRRMHLQFSELLTRKGEKISISAYAISADGTAGVPANVEDNIGNAIINVLTNQLVASQTNDVGQIILEKSIGQTELETDKNISLDKGTSFTIFFNEPVII